MRHLNTNSLETVFEKVARSLSEKFGITVVFQGDRCCTNGKTIFLPSLPDELPRELLMVIRGWIDHESAHIIFSTDMKLATDLQRVHGPDAFFVFNIIEDARVEAAVTKRFSGSGFNLRMCYAEAAARAREEADKAALPPLRQFAFAVYACVNSAAYPDFVEQDMCEITDELAPLLRRAPVCADSQAAAVIALKVWEKIRERIKPEKRNSTATPEHTDKTDLVNSASAKPSGKAGSKSEDAPPNGVDPNRLENTPLCRGIIGDIAESIGRSISTYSRSSRSYRVWSTEGDRVLRARDQSSRSHPERMREVMPLVSGVRQKLLQSLLAEPKARWLGDQERGAVNPRSLHRLALSDSGGQQRIFRQRIRVKRLRTAVALLLDESQSMAGVKLLLAKNTAMVFCEALSRLNIPSSVIGFSTARDTLEKRAAEQTGMAVDELRSAFRLAPLRHTVYKRFDESFAKVSGKMEGIAARSMTPLGESMLFAARELLRRPEERKVLFVMTDGKPVVGINPEDVTFAHAKHSIARIEKAGINVALVGIQENCVSSLHHRAVVVHSLDQLSKTVMRQLRTALLAKVPTKA